MNKRFRSGISWWLVGYVLVVLIGTTLLTLKEGTWVGFAINMPILVWFVHMLMNTYYTVEAKTLEITCGIFKKIRISIKDILHVKETRNPFSSPALSMDRLEIKYADRKFVLISPKEKNDFINTLLEKNPEIIIKRSKSLTKVAAP